MKRHFGSLLVAGMLWLSCGDAFAAQAAHSAVAAKPGRGVGEPVRIDYALSPAQIAAHCTTALRGSKVEAKRITSMPAGKRSFSSIVLAIENVSADLNDNLVAETLLSSVAADRPVRDASLKCQNDVNDYLAEMTASPDLYLALRDADGSGTAHSAADRKLTAVWLTALRRSGAGLPPTKRREFIKLNQRLGMLQNEFGANLGNDRSTVAISPTQIAGLPPDLVATFARRGGDYIVPVNESTSERFLQNADDALARKAFYLAYNNRQVPKNIGLLKEAIGLRAGLAGLLGYKTWAEYVLADRMAQTPGRVRAFLDDLDAKLLPKARADVANLSALKAKTLGAADATIDPWDVVYYDNLLRKTQYAVDTNVVREYFPVDHTIEAVFGIYSRLLGVTFAPRKPANAWAPDVTQWSVTDTATGRYIGDFYLDLFPRDGKYSHFASFPILPNRVRANGSVRPPQDAIIGNWPKPAPGKPALLSHQDVETFFHEFGHDMATLLATTPYETLSSGFRQDFVEAPSQMLENWVWDPQVLKEISSQVESHQPLPDDVTKKIIAARYVDNAYFTTRQILLADVDLAYHSGEANIDTTAVWATIAREKTPIGLPPGIHPEAQFGHLMGGYDAGYYGYLWSKVYAQDMFTAFVAGGLENPAIGARYRRDILQPAREREPDAEVQRFLGRPVNPDAFYREFGVDTKQLGK